jgi:hypothetical protein
MLVRNATLPDGRAGLDVLVRDGRIAAVGPALAAPEGVEVVDAGGWLLSPPFVDAHFHMDATLSYGLPRVNRSGTLLEGIALWGELKPLLTQQALVDRALAYCDWAVARGLLAIRTHVDVCDERLLAVEDTAGVRALKTDRYELDVGFAGAFGSRSDEVPARQGMPRLGTMVEFGPRLKWRLTPDARAGGRWTLELPVRGVFDVDDGFRRRGVTVEPELDYDLQLAGGLKLGLRGSVIFGDRALAETFYGVAPAFATAGRPAYQARAGLVAWRLGASLSRPLGPDWRVFGFVRLDSVHGAANADSPLVRRPTDATAGVGLTWTWLRSASRGSE